MMPRHAQQSDNVFNACSSLAPCRRTPAQLLLYSHVRHSALQCMPATNPTPQKAFLPLKPSDKAFLPLNPLLHSFQPARPINAEQGQMLQSRVLCGAMEAVVCQRGGRRRPAYASLAAAFSATFAV